ncbi:MAG: hypothetical protein ACR2P6_04545, partial [Gammaproteobacteria bacterium]
MWGGKRASCIATAAMLLCCVSGTLVAGSFPVDSRSDFKIQKARLQAVYFLNMATFGPTTESVDALADRIRKIGAKSAYEEWIDEQFDLPASTHWDLARQM